MKASTRTAARSHRFATPHKDRRARHMLGVLAALSLLVVSTAVQAEPGLGRSADVASALPTASMEVNAAAPHWRGTAGATPRASLEVDTRQAAGRWDDGSSLRMRYVRWAPAGAAGALGVSMGVGATQPAAYGPYALADAHAGAGVAPEVGVRWRSRWQSNRRVDVGAFGSYDTAAATPLDERKSYNARVELQFRENKSKLGFDVGSRAFGMQLSGTSKLMLRTRHGGPMVYYRSTW